MVYQNTNFKICLSLFGCEVNILAKQHIVQWFGLQLNLKKSEITRDADLQSPLVAIFKLKANIGWCWNLRTVFLPLKKKKIVYVFENSVRKCLPRCFSLEPEAKTWRQFVFSRERAPLLKENIGFQIIIRASKRRIDHQPDRKGSSGRK